MAGPVAGMTRSRRTLSGHRCKPRWSEIASARIAPSASDEEAAELWHSTPVSMVSRLCEASVAGESRLMSRILTGAEINRNVAARTVLLRYCAHCAPWTQSV